jgi:hypothetical protein
VPPKEPISPVQALALFAESLTTADLSQVGRDATQLMREALQANGWSFDDLPADFKQQFEELFGDLSPEELAMLARLQQTMVALDPHGVWGLSEKVPIGSHATLAKL